MTEQRRRMFEAWDDGVKRTRALRLAHRAEAAERSLRAWQRLAVALVAQRAERRRPGATVVRRPTLADFMEARRAKGGAS